MKEMKWVVPVIAGFLFAMTLSGCGVSTKKYEALQNEKIALEEKCAVLMKAKDALKNEYDYLLKEKMDIATRLEALTNEKKALKDEYDKILEEKISLKASYDKLLADNKAFRDKIVASGVKID